MLPSARIDVQLVEDAGTLAQHRQALEQLSAITATHVDLDAELTKDHSHLWVAAAEAGQVQAYLIAWHVADELQIVDVATLPSVRRRGLGRTLLEAALAFARATGCGYVLLEVRADNHAAQGLYQQLGFETQRVRRGYYDDGTDGWEMGLAL